MPYDSDIIVIGCGNILFKDDGFGPVLINILQKYYTYLPYFVFLLIVFPRNYFPRE